MEKELRNLLIIEDEKLIAEDIAEIVGDLFDAIHFADTVEKAKSQLYQYEYALIILDINLKGKNGVEILKFLVDNPVNPNNRTPFFLMSGIINDDFIKKHSTKFAALISKPFEPEDLRKKILAVIGQNSEKEKNAIKKSDLGEIPIVAVNTPFDIGDIQRDVLTYLAAAKKKPKHRDLFLRINVDRDVGNFFLSHIGLIINCAMAISNSMDWHNERTLEKYVYAAYLHDVSLSSHPELAKYKNLTDMDADLLELGIQRYNQAAEHTENSFKQLQAINDLPQDVDLMVRMHHERPDGTGFPYKADHKKMNPVVSVFIAAHDLADYIYANENWDLNEFIKSRQKMYLGNSFKKILIALEQIANSRVN